MKRWRMLGITVGVALMVLTGCTSGGGTGRSSSAADYVSGGTFRFAYTTEVPSFNPYKAVGYVFARYGYDSLVNVTESGEVVSGLAETWETSATEATFTLRSGIKCSDGTELRASDVAKAVSYVKDPKNASPVTARLLPSAPFTIMSDDAARTVTVKMGSPYSFIARTIGLLPIVCAKGLANPKVLDHATHGTGPFNLTSYTTGGPYTFSVRSDYAWGPDGATTRAKGTPGTVVVSVVQNYTTAANQLLAGELNASLILGADVSRLAARGLFRAELPTTIGYTRLNEKPIRVASDPNVRQALLAGLDRAALAKVATAGNGKIAASLQPLGTVCHANTTADNLPAHDIAAARQLLEDGGWVLGSDGIRTKDGRRLHIKLVANTSYGPTIQPTAELMARQWKALGVDVSISTDSGSAFVAVLYQTGDWDVAVFGSNFSLPSQLIPSFNGPPPPSGNNLGSVNNAKYDALVAEALAQASDASCPAWNKAEAALLSHGDVVPIADGTTSYFGAKTQFAVSGGVVIPTSIRMLK